MLHVLKVSVLAVIIGILCQAVLAQDGKPQPVARLITSLHPVTTKPSNSAPADPTAIERRAFEETNLVRVKNGLQPFVWDEDICRMARIHSESMSSKGYFSHVTPEGLRLRERARVAGILQFSVLGENIAYNQGYEDPGAFAVERWMASRNIAITFCLRGFARWRSEASSPLTARYI